MLKRMLFCLRRGAFSLFAPGVFITLLPCCSGSVDDELATGEQVSSTSQALSCAEACTGASCNGRIKLSDKRLPYYRNYPLGTDNDCVTRAIVMVHGTNRNADDYFAATISAAQYANFEQSTIILAPDFQDSASAAPDELSWGGGWRQGDTSNNAGTVFSSFAVMDKIVAALANRERFPNLRTIVIAGHSAGGQYVQRYAIGTRADEKLPSGTSMRFIVANPSSYAYLSALRPLPSNPTQFSLPWTTSNSEVVFKTEFDAVVNGTAGYPCIESYDSWKYGLSNRNSYMSALSPEQLRENYQQREVAYFLGTADTGSADLDVNCEAMLQGPNRFERGKSFHQFMKTYYPADKHYIAKNPGVGHSVSDMYNSFLGRLLLFY